MAIKIREEIQCITKPEQVRQYITNLGLTETSLKDNKPASKITTAEYKYLYSVIYNTPLSASTRKDIIVGYIINYFESIDRAQALRP